MNVHGASSMGTGSLLLIHTTNTRQHRHKHTRRFTASLLYISLWSCVVQTKPNHRKEMLIALPQCRSMLLALLFLNSRCSTYYVCILLCATAGHACMMYVIVWACVRYTCVFHMFHFSFFDSSLRRLLHLLFGSFAFWFELQLDFNVRCQFQTYSMAI